MVSERNRILDLKLYFESLGIKINIGKTKARGHKGIFMHGSDCFRIDISRDITDKAVESTLLHEFAHYLHYQYDKNLLSLSFVFGELTDYEKEELIRITVNEVPKEFALALYSKKETLAKEVKKLTDKIKKYYPDFKLTDKSCSFMTGLCTPINYLLKYDRIKYFNKIYSVDKLDVFSLNEQQKDYILLKSKQRAIKRINTRINRLNKYYNNPSELFARFVDCYFTNPAMTQKLAPNLYQKMSLSDIQQFNQIKKIYSTI